MKRRIGLILLGLFLLLNIVAFNHAWHFTHFRGEAGPRTSSPEKLSVAAKLGLLLTGVANPKPTGAAVPAFPYQTLALDGPNGRLEMWYSPVEAPKGSVALFHGYTSDKSRLLTEAAFFRSLGYSTLLVDMSGAGNSAGYRCTVGYYEAADVATAFQFLQQQRPATPIVLYGVSMGAMAILRAEGELGIRPAAAIMECPYGSLLETAQNRFRAMGVPAFPLANLLVFWGGAQNGFWAFGHDARRYARRIPTPTLLLYGLADQRVTRRETDDIFAALAGFKQRHYFPGAGHEPYWLRSSTVWQQQIQTFLNRALSGQQ
ncbi:alpha/beta hydrolase [Hymenobacter persicinus]|uniref:Alpha/beta hydrolase n=1 Tax=Hymenobacter persicinus TaxID=2025506 RepID=A0A4Q5LFX9_9BACT|nr:alpha/beta fold hydrolase [Hymenobacter persicinus]RYU82110.1 alpha/beta hydrolase [Hymenobacter persicinus]